MHIMIVTANGNKPKEIEAPKVNSNFAVAVYVSYIFISIDECLTYFLIFPVQSKIVRLK